MLRYVLLSLCLTPVFAQAEIACLEGPQGGKCHSVDVNGEIFKTSTPSVATVAAPAKATNNTTNKQRRIIMQIPANNKVASKNKTYPKNITIAEQKVRQRAQIVENRFKHKQGVVNLSQRDNTNRKQ